MSHNWGPYFIVPSAVLTRYSGIVQLREQLDEELLNKELEELGLSGPIARISNPWYCRRKNSDTWIKIGESQDKADNFPVTWDTSKLENGEYEVLGLMHVCVKKDDAERTIAKQNVVQISLKN